MDSGTRNLGFQVLEDPWVEGKRKLNKVFLYFLTYLVIFLSGVHAPKALRNFEKSSNMAKNEEKPCSNRL